MNDLDSKLDEAFERFERLQESFLGMTLSAPQDLLAHLPDWETRRQREAAILNFLLNTLRTEIDEGRFPLESSREWLKRLERVLYTEKVIYQSLEKIREDLRSRILHLSKGKKVLNCYHSQNNKFPSVVSMDA